jgi:MoCo/4Fe-4S cofactor protein with predicted Tat translocation signal
MKNKNQDVWVGVEQLTNDPAYNEVTKQEFKELPVVGNLADENTMETGASRRDFLKYLGFSLGAATVAASCDIPLKRAIPYVVKPDAIVPGVATYYASSFVQGGDYCSVLVKTREGRPIKIEGNSLSKVTQGGTSARAQASVLSLYDTSRFPSAGSMSEGSFTKMKWADLDKAVVGKLNPNSNIAIVANTVMSPTTMKAIADFQATYPNAKLVQYDPVSSAAMLDANEETLGQRAIPDYHFGKADVILSFGADFLGTWISPVEYAKGYSENRRIQSVEKAKMSRHIQVESYLSMTGSNADNRVLIKPSEMGAAIVTLYNELAALNGQGRVNGPKVNDRAAAALKKVAKELNNAKGHSLVVCGSNNKGEQILVNAINNMLSNYGQTISFQHASMQRKGSDQAIQQLIKDMNAGSVDAVFMMGANPAFDLPNAQAFQDAMAKVGLSVSFAGSPDETTAKCQYVAPTHHYLESWGDVEVKRGHYSLIQPTIHPLFNTRQAEESLLTWANSDALNADSEQPYFEYVKAHWEAALFPQQSNFATFQAFWDSALHDGVVEMDVPEVAAAFTGDVNAAASKVSKPAGDSLEISLYETVNVGNGVYADNPWLMEMPDPVARTAWGNHLAIPLEAYEGGNSLNAFKGLNGRELYGEADNVNVKVGDIEHTVTCVRQFGQPRTSVALALGYGRMVSGQSGKGVGVNVYPWLSTDADGYTQYYATQVEVSDKVSTEKEFACVQYHHGMGLEEADPETGEVINVDEKTSMTIAEGYQGGITNRSIIFKSNLSEIDDLLHNIEHRRDEAKHLNDATLYPFEEYTEKYYSQGHHWGMHVDLNACIGCGACQVACIAENNVPVVGKKEVARHHEMTWLRIDRYFFGDYENPNVVYQPMMCQHCDNAPCENVCPVAATNHSGEGLNQMTYNRCIGTRYCANNCPYKVRRFNWLDYTTADLFPANEYPINGEEVPFGADNLTRMVLNPDVTVRSRGVIEKCSFCVQRIQEGKLTAKREQRRLRDADVKTACQTACPTGAITFGDRNNKGGELMKRVNSPLNYRVLEETNTQSSVVYSAKVVNRDETLDA